MFRIPTLALAAGLAALTAGGIVAQGAGPNPAIKARQALMTLNAFNLGTLGAMAQGKMPYDSAAAAIAATNLATLSHLDNSVLWPEGTDSLSVEGTRALPGIWDNMADVGAKAAALRAAADAMAAVAGKDLVALQTAMGPLGAACGGCHETYREPQ